MTIPADEGKRDYTLAQEKYDMIKIIIKAANNIQTWIDYQNYHEENGNTDRIYGAKDLFRVLTDTQAILLHDLDKQGLKMIHEIDPIDGVFDPLTAVYLNYQFNNRKINREVE